MREKLLKQALESGKTKSNKSKSKDLLQPVSVTVSRNGTPRTSPDGSVVGSRAGSRAPSRAPSRQPSDEDDDSEGSGESRASIDSLNAHLAAETLEDSPQQWEQILTGTIPSILERTKSRRTTSDQYTTDLHQYNRALRSNFAAENISYEVAPLAKSFLRTATSDSGRGADTILALRAFALTAITALDLKAVDFFELSASALKMRVLTCEDDEIKAECVHTLGLVTLLNGTEADTANLMSYFLEAISSDGTSLEAEDSALVVTAAIESYALLATTLTPAITSTHTGDENDNDTTTTIESQLTPETTHDTIATLASQLPSPSPPILIAAAEAIALLYALSYRPFSPVHDPPSLLPMDPSTALPYTHGLVQAYTPYRSTGALLKELRNISRHSGGSSKRISKAERGLLKTTFEDCLNSIQHPGKGPRWSDSLGGRDESNGSGKAGGKDGVSNKVKIRINGISKRDEGEKSEWRESGSATKTAADFMVVDTWVKWWRVKALKRWLSSVGLGEHYAENKAVRKLLEDAGEVDG